jgi:hypothetical protein
MTYNGGFICYLIIQVGDWVLKCNKRKNTRMGGKLETRFTGPFEIIEALSKGTFRLASKGKPQATAWNAVNLKRWKEATSPCCSPNKSFASEGPSPVNTPSKPPAPKNMTRDPPTPDIDPPSPVMDFDPATPPSTSTPSKGEGHTDAGGSDAPTAPPTTQAVEANWWVRDLQLTETDLQVLMSGAWLTDRHVDAWNKLIAEKIGAERNQTTLMCQTRKGFAARTTESVMIVHDHNHWVTVACIGGEVMYADSLNGEVSNVVAGQLGQLFPSLVTKNGRLCVTMLNCDMQPNGRDCGVYAAAFAVELVEAPGTRMLEVGFQHRGMREHLRVCLETGELTRFPNKGQRQRGRVRRVMIKV